MRLVIMLACLTALVRPGAEPGLGDVLRAQGYTAIPLSVADHGTLYAAVRLNGFNREMLLLVDTGAAIELSVNRAAAEAIGIRVPEIDTGMTAGNGLPVEAGQSQVDVLSFVAADYVVRSPQTLWVNDGLKAEVVVADARGAEKSVAIDGLLGQLFLRQHSAVIDNDAAVMYLMPPQKKDAAQLAGEWECAGGECAGTPLPAPERGRLSVTAEGSIRAQLGDRTWSGYYTIDPRASARAIWVTDRAKPDATRPYQIITGGLYSVQGDRLRLCLMDTGLGSLSPTDYSAQMFPTKLESKAGSRHAYYEFRRKPKPPAELAPPPRLVR